MPQERLREATNTCTAPLENRCSTAFLSMSLRPSWRYPTPLLSVSFRVYKLSTYFCKNFERTHTFYISILKRHVWDYFNPIIYCLWLHSNPILFPCYNCIQIPNFISNWEFKIRKIWQFQRNRVTLWGKTYIHTCETSTKNTSNC